MDWWSSVARHQRHPRDHGTWATSPGGHGHRREAAAIVAATLVLGTLGGLVALGATGRSSHRASAKTSVSVLGEELTKPVPPVPEAAAPVPQLEAAAPSVPPLQVAVAPTASAAPAGTAARPSSNAAAAVAAPALPVTPLVIHAFNQATFAFSPDPRENTAASSATSDRKGSTPVLLEVDGQAQNSSASLSVKVTNDSGRAIAFPGGLSVVVTLARDGSVVASTTASDPGVVTLPPSGTAVLGAQVPLSSYGSYAVDGILSYRPS